MSAASSHPTAVRLIGLFLGLALVATACEEGQRRDDGTPTGEGRPVAGGMLVDLQNFSAGNPEHLTQACPAPLRAPRSLGCCSTA